MSRVAVLLAVIASGSLGACAFEPNAADDPTHGSDDPDPTPQPQPMPPSGASCPDDSSLQLCLDFEDASLVPAAHDGSTHRNDAMTQSVTAMPRGSEQAMQVDARSFVEVYPNGSNKLFTTPMTFELWANPASLAKNGYRSIAAPQLYELEHHARDDGSNGFGCFLDGYGVEGGDVVAGAWTHLACTYDGHTLALYVNGERVDETTVDSVQDFDAGGMEIGDDDGFHAYSGGIDNIRIYSRLLTDEEISTLAHP